VSVTLGLLGITLRDRNPGTRRQRDRSMPTRRRRDGVVGPPSRRDEVTTRQRDRRPAKQVDLHHGLLMTKVAPGFLVRAFRGVNVASGEGHVSLQHSDVPVIVLAEVSRGVAGCGRACARSVDVAQMA
jgi:hypothetical protein